MCAICFKKHYICNEVCWKLEEKNKSYHFPQFIQFLKEIRRAANRRLKEHHADPVIAMELFKKVKIHLAQANECDVLQDSDLLKFQKLLFLGMILFTTQRANTFVKMSIDDIHCRHGTFMVYLDSGRKRSGRAGKSRYLFGRKWSFLKTSLILWRDGLRKRFYELNTDSHSSSSPSLKRLPVPFPSNCKPLSNYVISSWLDDVSGKHITITTLRKSITELAFSTDALTEEQAWLVAMLGDHTHKTVQQHYLKDCSSECDCEDFIFLLC
ncbi:hypothetical protein ADUPG1_012582 [Aduncisulcus paluster]|uniref:Uncharacterized protein n=1 Tax=Aduncisulcus paluster TaxID=2918883 RepID=A0ABQ5JZX8_9EUKA|nr:hypothetical protein ADUPG1_012582 [Aduncisulcus paluster]